MTPEERLARARRAQMALDEFITPLLTETRDVYAARIVEIAATELNKEARTDKITALSTAIRVLEELEKGIQAHLLDGKVADKERLRVAKLEQMTPARRRIFSMTPG